MSGELKKRIISAIILMPVILGAIYLGGFTYAVLIALGILIGLYEWFKISLKLENKIFWQAFGVVYLTAAGFAMIYLRGVDAPNFDTGMKLTFWLFLVIWATDIGGYVFGKKIGGPKIAPKISPNKTWAGLIGAMIFASVTSGIYSYFVGTTIISHVILAAITAVIAQVGDFFESWLKRRAGVKDSGALIAGHGGILDRIDGLLLAAIFVTILWVLRNGF